MLLCNESARLFLFLLVSLNLFYSFLHMRDASLHQARTLNVFLLRAQDKDTEYGDRNCNEKHHQRFWKGSTAYLFL